MVAAIFLIAVILILGQVFSSLFEKTRVPDVLPLMLLGFFLGPVLKLIAPESFGSINIVFTEIVLIVVLFQTGFNFRLSYLRDSFWSGTGFTFIYLILCVGVLYIFSHYALKLPSIYALIMAFILADTSLVVLIPILNKLKLEQRAKTVLTIETTIESIICVIVPLSLLGMAGKESFAGTAVILKIVYSILMACAVGVVAGLFWSTVLKRVRELENSTAITFAFVLLVYTASELLGSKGALGVLMFGLIVGNIRVFQTIWGKKFNLKTQSFKLEEKSFFDEIEFILKTLFFVYMGMSMYMQNGYFIICGLILALVKIIVRYPAVQYATPRSINRRDCAAIVALCPNGLISAVLAATVGAQLAGENGIQDAAYSVIFFSLILTSLLSFMIERGYTDRAANILFARHAPIPQPAAAPAPAAQEQEQQQTPENQG